MRILVISEDRQVAAHVEQALVDDGMSAEVVPDSEQGRARADSNEFVGVVVDSAQSDLHAFDLLREVCRDRGLAVIYLTDSPQVTDRVVGLELGADDVMVKPVDGRELSARLRAALRRLQSDSGAAQAGNREPLQVAGLSLCRKTRRVRYNGRQVGITAAEYGILERLMLAPGDLVAKDELAECALGRRLAPDDRSIDTHISRLRRKIRGLEGCGIGIQSIRGRGYMLAADLD